MSETSNAKSKVLAGVLGVIPLTGALGIHRFYLGYTMLGIVHIILVILGIIGLFMCGIGIFFFIGNVIWAIVEGIMIFAGSISKDAKGAALK